MISFRFPTPGNIPWSDIGGFLRFVRRRLGQARLDQAAGNLAFTTLFALVPLLTIALALFATFPLFGTLRTSLEVYFDQIMMPKQIAGTILGYLTIFTTKATHLSVIGALGVLVSSVAMINMIEQSFNQIWRIKKPRPIFQRIGLYLVIATIGPFLLAVSLTLTSYVFGATGGSLRNQSFLYGMFYTLLSVVWMTGAFTMLYVVIPNRTILWREAVWGGLFAAIAFEIVKRLFALFIVQFPSYQMIYGALAAVPIFLLWIYLSWLITLAGAALVAAIHLVWHGRWRHVATPGSVFLDAMAILKVLYLAAEEGVPEIAEADIRAKTGLGLDEIEIILQHMLAVAWVELINPDAMALFKERQIRADKSDHWKLAVNPQELTLASVYRRFVFESTVDAPLTRQLDAAVDQGLGETLAAHFAHSSS